MADSPGPIKLLKTAFVDYHHANLPKVKDFLRDFGLDVAHENPDGTTFFKGYGTEPFIYIARPSPNGSSSFGGAAYVVEGESELERAAQLKDAEGPIRNLEGPAGGRAVTLRDPAGHAVHLIHGWQETTASPPHLQKLIINFEDDKPRKGKFQRFEPGPAPVFRWGHYGVTYPEGLYEQMYSWYTTVISLAPSDIVYREYTDHHAFFFKMVKPGDRPSVAHAAFEVHDFDVQQLGHQHLTRKGYELCWGVGRHVLGSQVSDYWFDPNEFILEHYADGDLVNRDTPIAKVQAGPEALSVWGPPVPEVF